MTKTIDTLRLKNGGIVEVYHNTYSELLGFTEFVSGKSVRHDMKRYPQVTNRDIDDYKAEVRSLFREEIASD
jgi:hypothetical protein